MNPAHSPVITRLLSRCLYLSTSSRLSSSLHCSICSSKSQSIHPTKLSSDERSRYMSCHGQMSLLRICGVIHNSPSFVPRRTMAGHSKWQNIKHIKAAKDKEKAGHIVQITNKIRAVIRETGNADPKSNISLARLIAEAKSKNVPNSNIDSAIKQAAKAKDAASIVYYEGRGPGGSYFIVEASTDKPTKTRNDMQGLIKKQGASIGEPGTAKHAFDKKGVLEASVPGENVDMDKFVDLAIEAGAEEVTLETDETEEKYLRFLCEASDMYLVKKELEKKEMDLRSVSVEFIPSATVFPQPKEMELIEKVMEKLEDYPEVLRVFINVDAPDS